MKQSSYIRTKCIAVYLRLSQEDVDKRTNLAKDDSNSISAQRQIISRFIAQSPELSDFPGWNFVMTASLEQTLKDRNSSA